MDSICSRTKELKCVHIWDQYKVTFYVIYGWICAHFKASMQMCAETFLSFRNSLKSLYTGGLALWASKRQHEKVKATKPD